MTRRFVFLFAAVVAVILLILAVVVEQQVVTDREYLVDTIHVLADHVQNNNADGILQYIDDSNLRLKKRVRENMARYDFSSCSVIGFSGIQLDPEDASPRMANVAFSVWAMGSESGRTNGMISSSVAVRLQFKQINGEWMIEAYGYVAPANAQRSINMIRD